MFFGTWNIRGLVDPIRQAEVRSFIRTNKLSCIGIIETKVKSSAFAGISQSLCGNWAWISNYEASPLGRVWFGWNPEEVETNLIYLSDQLIHVQLRLLNLNKTVLFSVAYGEHSFVKRRTLWADLLRLSDCTLP